ncbi:hypothetical protein Dsin_015348 [Dipteronia sinensis]|uniref:Uncharacterized protein n=1 Tax=Dipteronia sinensis TaxID=43782 RepID=A0AAE0ACA6_9ROSI|nr:hypothetical protein Dsin_015348 [Dipteronia sinensis]
MIEWCFILMNVVMATISGSRIGLLILSTVFLWFVWNHYGWGLFVSAKGHDPQGKVFVQIFCEFVALVVACIVYKYKTDVRVVSHFAHYDRVAFAAIIAAHEKGLVETVTNVWDFHASAMLAAA